MDNHPIDQGRQFPDGPAAGFSKAAALMDGDWERNLEGLEMLVSLAKEHTEVGGAGGGSWRGLFVQTKWLVVTAVSCGIQMKASGKQVFLSFRSYCPLYGYNHKSQKVYFYK